MHPLAAGEVGEGDGGIAQFDGLLAQRCDGAPGGGIVDVHRGGCLSFDRLDEGVYDEEIHATVACAFGLAAPAFP